MYIETYLLEMYIYIYIYTYIYILHNFVIPREISDCVLSITLLRHILSLSLFFFSFLIPESPFIVHCLTLSNLMFSM